MRRLPGVVTVLLVGLGASSAGAVPATAPGLTPMPFDRPGYAAVSGGDISCPSVGNCVRLSDVDSEGSATVAVARAASGTGLATVVLPRPAGISAVTEVHYTSLSCPTATWCLALGVAEPPHVSGRPIFARLSHGVWSAGVVPGAAAQVGTVAHDVSCWDVGQCVAVGSFVTFGPSGGAWTARFDDGRWTADRQGPARVLTAASCVADGWCAAVGLADGRPVSYEGGPGAWTQRPMSVPSGASQAEYGAVSCGAVQECVSVGSADLSTGGGTPLIATLDSSGWSGDDLPDDASGAFIDVSCPATGSCVVVGDGDDVGSLISVRQTATGWVESALPQLPGWTEADLRHVDCAGVGACAASGSQGVDPETAIRETLSAGTWSAAALPVTRPPRAGATGVGCAGDGTCRSIGIWYDTLGARRAFSDARTDSAWRYPVTQPRFHGFVASTGGIACPAPYWCVASAVIEASGSDLPVVATLSQGTWTMQHLPMAAVADPGSASVSAPVCSAVGACRVLVNSRGASTTRVVADTLSGGAWRPVAVPAPSVDELTALSCATATDCTAFGSSADRQDMVAATLAGGTWTSRAVTAVPVDRVASLSCPAPASCVAVAQGLDDPTSHRGPLVWTLASGRWTGVRLALGTDTTNAVLRGISCPVVGHCVAVGFRDHGGQPTSGPLVGVLSGTTWTRTRPAVPSGVLAADLTAVACPDRSVTGVCRAVGEARTADGGLRPMSAPVPIGG